MNRKQELNAFIKECITNALIELMKKKNFEDITITELVSTAGVSRVSFYRNFESKTDVIEKYLREKYYEWEKDFAEHNKAPDYYSLSIYKHFYKYKEFNLLLYKQGLSTLIYEMIRWSAKLDECNNNIERYAKSMLVGIIFGGLDEWIRQGMEETPEQIVYLIEQLGETKKDVL